MACRVPIRRAMGSHESATPSEPLMRYLNLRPGLVTLLGLAVAAGGCSGGEAGREVRRTALADPSEGILVLGDNTLRFHIDHCDASPASGAVRPILAGHADLADGRSLHVTVLRTEIDSASWQSVGVDFGSEYWEARRGRSAERDGWWQAGEGLHDAGLGPLIEIRGDTVHAAGSFQPGAGIDLPPIPGSVTARCPGS
jgi:hypothetical protein